MQGLSKATVIVTHDQLEALTMADRITIMRDGIIEQIGTPHEVFTKPENAFVGSFIGTPQMNLLDVGFQGTEGSDAKVTIGSENLTVAGMGAASMLQPGSVTLGIRPRAFTVSSESVANSITVKSEIIEPMGAEILVHARTLADTEIRVVVPRQDRVATGETLHLVPEPGQVHIFDDSGKAVRQ